MWIIYLGIFFIYNIIFVIKVAGIRDLDLGTDSHYQHLPTSLILIAFLIEN